MYLGKTPTVEEVIADWSQRAAGNGRKAQDELRERQRIEKYIDEEVGDDDALE